MTAHRCPTPLGLAEMAPFCGVAKTTPTRWRYRGLLPTPDGYISGTVPYWWDTTIEPWARANGHWRQGGHERLTADQERRQAKRAADEHAAAVERLRVRKAALEAEIAAEEAAAAAARTASQATILAG